MTETQETDAKQKRNHIITNKTKRQHAGTNAGKWNKDGSGSQRNQSDADEAQEQHPFQTKNENALTTKISECAIC